MKGVVFLPEEKEQSMLALSPPQSGGCPGKPGRGFSPGTESDSALTLDSQPLEQQEINV